MPIEDINEEVEKFLNRLRIILNNKDKKSDVDIFSNLLSEWNLFYYCSSPTSRKDICHTNWGDTDYFSTYHKYWEQNHEQILGLKKPDREIAKQIAIQLEKYYNPFTPREVIDTHGLSKEEIANTRLFTSIHDFGFGFTINYFLLAKNKPYLFNPREILKKESLIMELATELGVHDYQPDKRIEWCRRCAKWLVDEFDGDAFNIGVKNEYDSVKIKKVLLEQNMGLANKKIDMFLRDMREYKVWDLKNFDKISVASDINTIRISLRTGLVDIKIPLLSSFMDIFGIQYSAIDSKTQDGWRAVWEEWGKLPDNHSVSSPALIDFIIYKMGQNCCKNTKRACEIQCKKSKQESCIVNKYALKTKCNGWCIFKGICKPEKKKLNPPKAISIFGQYGWTTAYSNEGGGLGLRS